MKHKMTSLLILVVLFIGIGIGHMTNNMTVKAADTSNYSVDVWQEGYSAGWQVAWQEDGYLEGWQAAWQSAYSSGWGACQAKYDMYGVNFTGNLTPDQVISLLESYRYNHQYFVDHPDMVGNMTGTVEDNQRLVENYSKIIEYVEQMNTVAK